MERLVFVHGFGQTRRCWGPGPGLIEQALAQADDDSPGRKFVTAAVDLPGHGEAATIRMSPVEVGAALAEQTGSGVLVGYSLGARMALHAALDPSCTLTGLVLISGTAGLADPEERATRQRGDDSLADRIEAIGVPAFVEEWLAQPMFATLPPGAVHRVERRTNTAAGLAASLRSCGTGAQESLWNRLGEITIPTLVMAGSLDPKFAALGRQLAGTLASGRFIEVPGAGHSVHLERPEEFATAVAEFVSHLRERS